VLNAEQENETDVGPLAVAHETGPVPPEELLSAGSRGAWRDAGPLALAGFAANGANVIVTVVVARLLATRGYGALAQLTSLFLIVSLPGTAVVVSVVRRVTALAGAGRAAPVRDWARRTHARALTALMVAAAVAFVARGALSRVLSIPEPLAVFAILFAGSVWVLLSLDRGLLQARRAYRTLAVNLLVEGGVRTVAVLALVGAGFGVTGAAWGILLGEAVTALHARFAADRAWLVHASKEERTGAVHAPRVAQRPTALNGRRDLGELRGAPSRRQRPLLDLGSSLVAMALLAYLQNVDIVVLGREAPHSSGAYAAISVASKALVFAAIALGGYLLPEAAIEWHRGGHALRQLGTTLAVLAIPGAALLVGSVLFPHRLLSLAFSARYVGAQSAFAFLVLAMVFLCGTVTMTIYLLAAGQRWIGALLLVGAVVATFAVAAAHGSLRPTARADLAVQAGLALITTCAFVAVHWRRASPSMIARFVA
jgi:O-antigen/teichoic acid export membrane protein